MGPVQVLGAGFDQPTFSGEVLAELTRLREAGIVRLLVLLLVSRAEDGTLETLTPPDGTGAGLGRQAAAFIPQADFDRRTPTRLSICAARAARVAYVRGAEASEGCGFPPGVAGGASRRGAN